VLPHKHSHNNIAVRLAVRRRWRHPMDLRQWQRLTGRRLVNPMDRLQVSLKGNLRDRA
jgi:hypothetical protein